MNYLRPELIERLAAEYALGTLSGLARRRFVRLMKEHDMVQRRVNVWEDRLNPLSECLPAVTPPVRVWQSIAQRLRIVATEKPATHWFDSLVFWRTTGIASAALALLLLAIVVVNPLRTTSVDNAPVVAVLSAQDGNPAFIARFDASHKELQLASFGVVAAPSDRDFELWTLPAGHAPISLGVIKRGSQFAVRLDNVKLAELRHSDALAVSIEPVGGSPTGAPTGPITLTGKLKFVEG